MASTPKKARAATTSRSERLTPQQDLFCREYLVDLNGSKAALRAGYSPKAASQQGSYLLALPKVQARVQMLMDERAQRLNITADVVLHRWWTIHTADANELIQMRRVNCRWCWGEGHAYQWQDHEYELKCEEVLKKDGLDAELPDNSGGMGFTPNRPPHPDCPRCSGEGEAVPFIADTRKLSAQARMLYRGVKVTRDGVQVLMADQDKALENVARHIGMLKGEAPVINQTVTHNETNNTLIVSRDDALADLTEVFGRAAIGLADDEDGSD